MGKGWRSKAERSARLEVAADILRGLFRGETINAHHPWFDVEQARLWSLPRTSPRLFGSALTQATAAWLGSWADGMITVRKPKSELQDIVQSFLDNGGRGKPLALQLQLSWGVSRDDARMSAWNQWRNAVAPNDPLAELRTPEEFDELTKSLKPDDIESVIPLVTGGQQLLDIIDECKTCGFEEIYIHNVSHAIRDGFIRFMSREVLPALQ